VPDFGAFAGLSVKDKKSESSATWKDYEFEPNEKVVDEYIKLLTETYNFEVRTDYRALSVFRNIVLYYTGTASGLSTFDAVRGDGASIDLFYYNNLGSLEVTYADGLEYTDTGHRTTQTVTPAEEESSSSDGNYGDKECGSCFGSGKCSNCNGRGTVRKALIGTGEWVEQDCTWCVGGKCSDCHGKGYR